jgi:threonine aldolase
MTPTWNLSSLDQTLARGIRLKSHRYLPPQTTVKIFLHVSTQEEKNALTENITRPSKIQINHSEKLVLFTYNTATLQKDIQTILNECKIDSSDPKSVDSRCE